jgi:hypothetical protein
VSAASPRQPPPLLQQSITRAFRVLDTGIINDPDALAFERKRPIRLDLRPVSAKFREQMREAAQSSDSGADTAEGGGAAATGAVLPYTSLLLLEHVFRVAKLMRARHIHLKYIESSGDCIVLLRTEAGLVPYSTINNKHWIHYLMVHATGQEEPKEAGEGEFRLEIILPWRHEYSSGGGVGVGGESADAVDAASSQQGGIRAEYSVNIIYIEGGVKLTLSAINL